MVIGWGILVMIGVIVARYLRRFPLQCDEWYSFHTVCQTVGYILGTVGWCFSMWFNATSSSKLSASSKTLTTIAFAFLNLQVSSITNLFIFMATSAAMDGVAAASLRSVLQRVQLAAERSGRAAQQIRVVAVSKTKPVSVLREVYDAGHRCFGENYVQELVEKAPQLPEDIKWHFIGNLQSNKVKPLLGIRGAFGVIVGWNDMIIVQDQFYMNFGSGMIRKQYGLLLVCTSTIANRLDRAVANIGRKPLKIFVQVNTSGEISKSGVDPAGCVDLVKHIRNCPNLEFCGLMTIGMLDYSSTPENFQMLSNCKSEVCKAFAISEEQCELSMGMSADFEQAIEMGSTNVRIGSTIFGAREYPKKQNH
ncbi:proline synthase co-transcribed bacterial-like protein [Senna tora]|uniref:Pyridoxal phosphate homeostasis protein n=1 Tax=Senna tora TaxID=362788 RepID=A0A834SXQ5_9FABA|nr:proline synthase co-transcribed bacterial-like protein [Senna tora]